MTLKPQHIFKIVTFKTLISIFFGEFFPNTSKLVKNSAVVPFLDKCLGNRISDETHLLVYDILQQIDLIMIY